MAISIGRRQLIAALGGALSTWPFGAIAQIWPQRLVQLVVPYAPGGGNDAFARILAAGLSKLSGYQIIVENKSREHSGAARATASVPLFGYRRLWARPLWRSVMMRSRISRQCLCWLPFRI